MKTRVAQVSLSRYKRFSRTKTEKTVKHEVVCAKSGIGNTWNVSYPPPHPPVSQITSNN